MAKYFVYFYQFSFSLSISDFFFERNEYRYSFGVFCPCRNTDWRAFPFWFHKLFILQLGNFILMRFTKFLFYRISMYFLWKAKNVSADPQLVYRRHFEKKKRKKFKVSEDIFLSEITIVFVLYVSILLWHGIFTRNTVFF